MRKSDVYKSNWLKAESLSTGEGKFKTIIVTVKSVGVHEFDDGKQQVTLAFRETDQQLGLNLSNFDNMVDVTGKDDSDNWVGERIELWVDKNVMFQGKKIPAVRVRAAGGSDNGLPPADSVKDKIGAWNAYCALEKAEGRIKPDAERWKALVAGVVKSAGLDSHEKFTAAEWQAVVDAASPSSMPPDEIPASDIPF